MKSWKRAGLAAVSALLLLWLDGWITRPAAPPPERVPETLRRAFAGAAEDLESRALAFAGTPEVSRSLQGGGVAVDRAALFAAARQSIDGAPSGCWIALTDLTGDVHAWWGEAPSPAPRQVGGDGFSTLWSATTLTLVYRHPLGGSGVLSGSVVAARSFPVSAPAFGQALGLSGAATAWRPVGRAESAPLLRTGDAFVGVLWAPLPAAPLSGRVAALLLALGIGLVGFARAPRVAAAGLFLALVFLSVTAFTSAEPRVLGQAAPWTLAVGIAAAPAAMAALRRGSALPAAAVRTAAGYGLLVLTFVAAGGIPAPELTGTGWGGWSSFAGLAGLIALAVASLAFRAAGRRAAGAPQKVLMAAVLFTTAAIVVSLAAVPTGPAAPVGLFLVVLFAFELWARAVGPRGEEPFVLPRLLAGAAMLVVLSVSALRESARTAEAFRVASAIRLPDPERPSTGAVAAAQQATNRVARFDLRRDLPAPASETDLSDLAYRIWRDGAEGPEARALISYEIFDAEGRSRSRFSLIPEAETAEEAAAPWVRIDRFRLAVVRRSAPIRSGEAIWGSARVDVADWPSWDRLPPRIGVYRRLVLGRAAADAAPAAGRPVLASYAADGEGRDEGPKLSRRLLERLRHETGPLRARFFFRGEELCGEVRPSRDGYRLVAVPVPGFFARLLTAGLLIPGIVLVDLLGMALLLGRRMGQGWRGGFLPRWARTFRGRLVALFVLGVLIPLFAMTFFLRAQIETRLRRETVERAASALGTARRVLDDYLPSAGAGRRRLGLLDDTLIAWLANAVGYDLSVYAPDGALVATSRRDLYASGLVPDRAPASVFVSVGLEGAGRREGSRQVAGGRFEEIATALSAVPGVPGLTSPGLLSLLLLPQQEVAAAEASQLTAAVWAFAVLIFLISAALAGRLTVRVARPVADLVEGTRAVAQGDFSPRLVEPPDEELKELVRAFLSMSRSLRDQTEAVSREKERLATLLSHLTAGVVALGEEGKIVLANPAAVSLGGGNRRAATVEELFPGEAMRGVRAVLRESPQRAIAAEVEPQPGERWRIVSVPLPPGGEGDRMAVIEDVSDVVRSQRLAAWAEMARMIAHEIKNPLTPIRLSVEHLREVWRRGAEDFDRVLEECVANVLRQTEELRRSAAEFADYARLPRHAAEAVDVARLLREAAASFAGAPRIGWHVDAEPGAMAEADPRLLARVFSNLLGNAVEALGSSGGRIGLKVSRDGGRLRVTVEDDGPGVPPEILPRLFEPYFSARSGGTGLGLAIVKKIIEEHGGSISAENRREGGFRVTFDLPLARTAAAAPVPGGEA